MSRIACPLDAGGGLGKPNRSANPSRSDHSTCGSGHTAQIPNDERTDIENKFKGSADVSKINLLACSPTLEMGIDVGGLEAVVLRNVPPRPDNYAQRGGRAGRRLRIGMVVGYARSTPHDQYFYDHPEEMISGEVPAPVLSLANRDVLLRHVNAIVFGACQPGLAGRMADYVSPVGEILQETVDALKTGITSQVSYAISTAEEAFGSSVFALAQIHDGELRRALEALPGRVQDIVSRTARQVTELRHALDTSALQLIGGGAARRAGDLVARLLGLPTDRTRDRAEADDRSAGYPLRRFAEFGVLPGYEFPTEPASLRLLGDPREEDPVTVTRRFGIGQFQPGAQVYARSKRWKVIGLDTASPWNPQITDAPSWIYRICRACELRYESSHPGTTEEGRETCSKLRSRGPGFEPLIEACQYALQLPRTLPDLVCTETVQRKFSPKQKPDTITAEVTVEKVHSHYADVTVNGKGQARARVSGDDLFAEQVTSTGEFAGPFNVFNELSQTEFASPIDAVIGRRHVKRYDFRVKRENNVGWKWFFVGSAINPGYHGSVYVDGTSGEVVRLVLQVTSSEVDPETPVSKSTTTLDYGDVVIGAAGARHVPVRDENVSCFRRLLGCVRDNLTSLTFTCSERILESFPKRVTCLRKADRCCEIRFRLVIRRTWHFSSQSILF